MTNRSILALLCSLLAFAGWATSASAEQWMWIIEPANLGANCLRFYVFGSSHWVESGITWTPGWKPNQYRVHESQPDDWGDFTREMKCRSTLAQLSLDEHHFQAPDKEFFEVEEGSIRRADHRTGLALPFRNVSAVCLHWSFLPYTLMTEFEYRDTAWESEIQYQTKLANLVTAAMSKEWREPANGARSDIATIVPCLLWCPNATKRSAEVTAALTLPPGVGVLFTFAQRTELESY